MMQQALKKDRGHTRFWCILAALLVLIFARYGLQINIPRFVYLILIALIAVCGDYTELIALFVCLIPMHESVDFYYSIVICVVIYTLKYYRKIRVNLCFILVFVMIAWELLHCFRTDFNPVLFVTSVTPFIAIAIIMCSDISEFDYGFTVRVFAVATIAICITMLCQVLYWSNFNLVTFFTNLRRLGVITEDAKGIAGGVIQTNSLGVICVLVTTGLLHLRSAGRQHRGDVLLMLVLLIFGALTSSRTFLACLALMVLLMVFGQRGGIKKKLCFLLAIAAAFAVVFVVLSIFFPDQLAYFISRFSDSDITTGRDDLMIAYHDFITENPKVMFFGIGLQDYSNKLVNFYRVANNVPHNSMQEIIIAWGIIGVMLITAMVVMMIRVSRKHNKYQTLLNYIPLIIILFKSMAGQLLTSGYTLLALVYAYLSLCQDFTPKSNI